MKLEEIIDVIRFMLNETKFSTEKIKQYDLNNDGIIDMEDFVSMCELYAKNLVLESSIVQKQFRVNIRKLFKSDKLSSQEKEFVGLQLERINTQYELENKVSQSDSKMFSSKKGAEILGPDANIIEENQS